MTTTLTGTLVALGTPPFCDATGIQDPPRALVSVTEDAIRALAPNLTYREVVIVGAEEWAAMQTAEGVHALSIVRGLREKLAAREAAEAELCDFLNRLVAYANTRIGAMPLCSEAAALLAKHAAPQEGGKL
jgi:hypothetical protein